MIQYALKCDAGHGFDSWFQSAAAFDTLHRSGHLTCAICGSSTVQKAIMAPRVTKNDAAPPVVLDTPPSPEAHAIAKMRAHVEANADYVGPRFAAEARAMHLDGAPERAIYGEANGAEAKALIEEGVPVAPLPFIPNRKSN